MSCRILPAVLAFALLLTGAAAQELVWETDLEAAKAKAVEQNRPLLILMHNTTEIACVRMLSKVYTDPEVRAALGEFVLLPTCFDRHEEVAAADGKKVSKFFGGIGCDELTRNEKVVREELLEKSEVKVPQHVFVDGKGEIYLTKIYELKKAAFLDLLHRGLVMFGSKGVAELEKDLRKQFEEVASGNEKRVRAAIRKILELQDPRKSELLYYIIQGLRKPKDRAMAIRAFGSDEFTFAAKVVIRWLDDPDPFVRNCAVVSLEEMKAADAGPRLLEMWGKEKRREKELRKDLLRAFGPCCDGSEASRKILLDNVKSKDEIMRAAAYMSLGYYLDDEEVRATLPKRWKKEGKDVALKTAILYAYGHQRDTALVPDVEKMIENEKNGQLKLVGRVSIAKLKGEDATGIIGGREYHKLFSPLYTRDKIERNRRRFWKSWR